MWLCCNDRNVIFVYLSSHLPIWRPNAKFGGGQCCAVPPPFYAMSLYAKKHRENILSDVMVVAICYVGLINLYVVSGNLDSYDIKGRAMYFGKNTRRNQGGQGLSS